MTIYLVHTADGLLEETERSLAPFDHVRVDVTGDNFAYGKFMAARWAARDHFIVVEHDVEFPPSAMHELMVCPEWWCAFPYVDGIDTCCLGLAKIGPGFMAAYPDLWRESVTWEKVSWHMTAATGLVPHQHLPPILNH